MKKKLVLILATLMCISLCACGGSESTSGDNKENDSTQNQTTETNTQSDKTIELSDLKLSEDDYYIVTKEQLKYCLEKVTITKDNWNEYFGTTLESVVEENGFGDVVEDKMVLSFGLKNNVYGAINTAGFKFNERVVLQLEDNEWIYKESKLSDGKVNYYSLDKTLIQEINTDFGLEAYVIEYKDSCILGGVDCHYDDCIDAYGEIIVINLPIEVFEKDTIKLGSVLKSTKRHDLGAWAYSELIKYVEE